MQYPGGKNQSGTFQKLINIIPPHSIYLELFAGSAAIYNNIDTCSLSILMDIDPIVCANLSKIVRPGAIIINHDAISFLKCSVDLITFLHDIGHCVFMYLDPPYPFSVRKSVDPIYKYEMSDPQHVELLKLISHVKFNFAISSYQNELYDSHLSGCNIIDFNNATRQGIARERVYFNYELPDKLHDYSFIGNDFRERAKFKMQRDHMVSKINRMPALLRNSILDNLNLKNFCV